ncbi:MAG: NAD-glutamate dehydrogenase [Bdellovibrionota bacterium]
MTVSLGSSIGSESANRKLDQLREYFAKQPPVAQPKKSESNLADNIFLAEALFARAPSDYLESSTVDELGKIAIDCGTFYRDHLSSGKQFSVAVRSSAVGSWAILTAMTDRPFIVDTLTELLRVNRLQHNVLLHPILRHDDGRLTSLTYFEVEGNDDPALFAQIQKEIDERFTALLFISDDFKSMVGEVESAAAQLVEASSNGKSAEADTAEAAALLKWLADGGFVFLGAQRFSSSGAKKGFAADPKKAFGLFRSGNPTYSADALDFEKQIAFHADQQSAVYFAKSLTESPVHRYGRMDAVTVRLPGAQPSYLALVGLLTSKAVAQEAASVPLIRKKLQKILELEGLPPNSHDYKEIVSIVDSLPKSEVLQYPVEILKRDIDLISTIQGRSELKVRSFVDPLKRLISILAVMPRERYSAGARQQIMVRMEKIFGTSNGSTEFHTTTTDYPLYVLHLLLPNPEVPVAAPSVEQLEEAVNEVILTWEDVLIREFADSGEELHAGRLVAHYSRVLPQWYKAAIQPAEARYDIQTLDSLSAEHPLEASLEASTEGSGSGLYDLKLYKQGESLTLSAILPYLENIGFNIVHETVTQVTTRSGLSAALYKLQIRTKSGRLIDLDRAEEILLPGLKLVLSRQADNDRLNELMLFPGLGYREVAILRVLTHYLWQIKASTSDQAIVAALVDNPTVASKVVQFFLTKFDPDQFAGNPSARAAQLETIREEFAAELKSVSQLIHDRTLRRLLNVIDATVRTNFFRVTEETRICLKIDCQKIERMPLPRPFFEIFVNAPDFEGVHLRGGKVARGGIRWSDREDDYRTEVLGLMKTQMVKNSIIIPVGAKGGFVLKHRPAPGPELSQAVKRCYTRFIRSLLEVTDNRVGDQVVGPARCVVYDAEDPYFVVAADRGTATFSDTANELAVTEFQFWLGDAFASGGSNGYDHKKLAITSRGVWEAVCRHFREIGIDPEQQEFTAVGIGDMSGDVFGNGLLRSRKAKLLAAFDHRHIFIDPNPDPETSFEERLRMFNLPQSSWADYDAKLISTGGGVFPRSQKEIPLSPEAQQALGIQQNVLSGQELIRAILRAPVDLLWNGGIGTYFKSAEEDDLAVGDRTNDEVRVDARELRAKVVGEGGNLGFTQRARIEYSKIGGHINTDAVDNSGGVNCSDLEVNLKILLSAPVARGELTPDERNKVLTSYAEEVCQKVVARNRSQSRALSLGVRRSRKHLGFIKTFMHTLESDGLLDRKSEFLPDDETLNHRIQLKAGLTRPELAVLVGYGKMSLFHLIINSTLPEDPFLQRYLFNYFPKAACERFPEDIVRHPLRREIVATEIANAVVERMGATFVHRAAEESGVSKLSVIRAYLAADAIVNADHLTAELEVLDKPNATRQHLLALLRLMSAIDNMTRWILDHRPDVPVLGDVVARYGPSFELLVQQTDALATQAERNRFRESCKQLIVSGVPKDLAYAVTSLSYTTVYLDIIEISILSGAPVLEVAKLFSNLYVALHIRPLLEQTADLEATDRWEESAITTLTADVRRAMAKVALAIIQTKGGADLGGMEAFLESRKEIIARFHATYQEFSGRQLSVPALLILTNQLFALSRM